MSNVKAYDISAWQRQPPPEWFKALAADGHKLGVIQLWGSGPDDEGRNRGNAPNPAAAYQLRQTAQAGMAIAGYIVIPRDTTVKTNQLIAAGIKAAGVFARDLKFIAADIESNEPIHPASPGQRLSNALADIRVVGQRAIIYTSRSKWPKSMGTNVTAFNRVPLWDASYLEASGAFGGWRDFVYAAMDGQFIKYGGWEKRAMWQLAGTVSAVPDFDNKADLNLADFARLGITDSPIEEVPTDMPDPRVDDILTRLSKVEKQAHGHTSPPPPPSPTPASPRYDVLQQEDGHATGFAQRNGISFARLQELNPSGPPSGDWNLVHAGEKFRVA